MSREVPLTASEKIKIVIVTVIVICLFFPLVRFGVKELYRRIVRDPEGYEKAMEQAAEHYKFKVVIHREGLNVYNLEVDASMWRSGTDEQKKSYCDECQKYIYKLQQQYKMYAKDEQPLVNFYVNAIIRADAINGVVTLY